MNKANLLKRLNPLLFLALLFQAASGVFYFLVGGEVWEDIHLFGGFMMIVIAGLHIFLNWGWVKSNYFKKKN